MSTAMSDTGASGYGATPMSGGPRDPSSPPAQPTASIDSLYRGRGFAAEAISKMGRDGRVVSREQKIRWQENREFYRGNQWVHQNIGQAQVQQLARGAPGAISRVDHNSYNNLRRFTDGRIALLTKDRPPYEVSPEDNDQDSIDAARQAEKILGAKWGRLGWNIKSRLTELAKNAEIDGISWLFVEWDPNEGDSANQRVAVLADGRPITSRSQYEALKIEDPMMQSLWKMAVSNKPVGDVCWRVVLPGALSVDPFATKNFDDAGWIVESRIRPRAEVEARMGQSFKTAVAESSDQMREQTSGQVQYQDLSVDDGSLNGGGRINEKDGVVVHYLYVEPCPDWPKGAHIEFADRAPAKPLLAEPWDTGLPYFCYVPRPDPGHYLRSRGIVDDLKPIQRDFNQTLHDLRTWLRKVSQMPIGLPRGGLISDSVYNEDGYFEYNGQFGPPTYMSTPSEPTAIFTNNLVWMTAEMERISGVSSYAQGMTTPGGPTATSAISGMIQQTEQNLAEVEVNFVDAIEWGCSRSLALFDKNATNPRKIMSAGVDDSEQFEAFAAGMLRGCYRMRVTGPIMPKSKATRMNSIAQFAPLLGDKILPYLSGLIDGDPTELQRDVEIDRQHQKNETRKMIGLVTNDIAKKVYANFDEDKKEFAEAYNIAVQQPGDPMQTLAADNVFPPKLTPMLRDAGVDVPLVEDFHNHAMELKALDDYRKSDGYPKIEDMAKQLLREHAEAHKAGLAQQVQAMAQQQPIGTQAGSAPNPKGVASPPKSAPTPGGNQ